MVRETDADAEVDGLLPLAPAFLHILIALGDGERHGYGIMQDVAERTDGRVRMSPGTLYGSIKRMLAEGLIEELTNAGASTASPVSDAASRLRRRSASHRCFPRLGIPGWCRARPDMAPLSV